MKYDIVSCFKSALRKRNARLSPEDLEILIFFLKVLLLFQSFLFFCHLLSVSGNGFLFDLIYAHIGLGVCYAYHDLRNGQCQLITILSFTDQFQTYKTRPSREYKQH